MGTTPECVGKWIHNLFWYLDMCSGEKDNWDLYIRFYSKYQIQLYIVIAVTA